VSPTTRAAVAFVLVAAAGPIGFFTYRFVFAGRLPQPREAAPTHDAAPSTPPPSVAPPSAPAPASANASTAVPSIPAQLPDLTLPDQTGTARKLSDWRGRPLLVNFWATWCAPCRHEIPLLEKLLAEGAADHLQVVGIAVDDRAAALKYAHDLHVDYPVLVGGETAGLAAINAFGMADALPFTVFADAKGRIVTVKIGELHADGARLILARVNDVDRGRLTLAAARKQISAGLEALGVRRAQREAGRRRPAGS
jgi:thiol-disulfide isomerase/thioredoxin